MAQSAAFAPQMLVTDGDAQASKQASDYFNLSSRIHFFLTLREAKPRYRSILCNNVSLKIRPDEAQQEYASRSYSKTP